VCEYVKLYNRFVCYELNKPTNYETKCKTIIFASSLTAPFFTFVS